MHLTDKKAQVDNMDVSPWPFSSPYSMMSSLFVVCTRPLLSERMFDVDLEGVFLFQKNRSASPRVSGHRWARRGEVTGSGWGVDELKRGKKNRGMKVKRVQRGSCYCPGDAWQHFGGPQSWLWYRLTRRARGGAKGRAVRCREAGVGWSSGGDGETGKPRSAAEEKK